MCTSSTTEIETIMSTLVDTQMQGNLVQLWNTWTKMRVSSSCMRVANMFNILFGKVICQNATKEALKHIHRNVIIVMKRCIDKHCINN